MNDAQLRGYLLEKIILKLLAASGFAPVTPDGVEVTGTPGVMKVTGRGATHQADAIGDFMIRMPFAHPARLIVEAKCVDVVGIDIIRNAVGVLKDINERYRGDPSDGVLRKRYHYQYAVFTSGRFTPDAIDFGFAHDIYTFPLGQTAPLRPILTRLAELRSEDFESEDGYDSPGFFRSVRERFDASVFGDDDADETNRRPSRGDRALRGLASQTRRLGGSLVAYANHHLQLHLVPTSDDALARVSTGPPVPVRITFDRESWYIEDGATGDRLLSFDLPRELFALYDRRGLLTGTDALNLKGEHLNEIQAIYAPGDRGTARQVVLRLDQHWLEQARRDLDLQPEQDHPDEV